LQSDMATPRLLIGALIEQTDSLIAPVHSCA
jgi:hypothetical protein